MNLHAEIVPVRDISRRQRDDMFLLMCRYYENMTSDLFEADLDEKQWVIQIVDRATKRLRGFSTQMLLDNRVHGRRIRVLFSGDTIVDHRFWGNNPLAQTWGRFAISLIDSCSLSNLSLYWFLIAKGYKTYRFLPVFFHEYYPRFDTATPLWATNTMDTLGAAKFPNTYDNATGIVRASEAACRLRFGVADVTHQRKRDPHVRFFESRNPGHVDGDELCCLAPLTRENFTPAASRVIGAEVLASAEES